MSTSSAAALGIPQYRSQYGNPGKEAISANSPSNLQVVKGGATQVQVTTPNASGTKLATLFAQSSVQSQGDAVGGRRGKKRNKNTTKRRYKKHSRRKNRKTRKSYRRR